MKNAIICVCQKEVGLRGNHGQKDSGQCRTLFKILTVDSEELQLNYKILYALSNNKKMLNIEKH